METGDFVVTGYGVLHSGFNGGPNIASAVNLACTGWLSYAIEHAAHWRTKLTIHIPFEKLLVLAAQKLADGEWWCGDAKTYEAWEPAEFRRDVAVMVSYLEEYLNSVVTFMEVDSQPGWGGKKPTAVALGSTSRAVQRFIVENAIQPEGEPLVLPNEMEGTATGYSVDGASCPHCGVVTWISAVVCPACIEQLGDDAVPNAPLCCWRCAPVMFDAEHDRLRQGLPTSKDLAGCHAPVLVQRLSNSSVYLLVDKLKVLGGGGRKGAS